MSRFSIFNAYKSAAVYLAPVPSYPPLFFVPNDAHHARIYRLRFHNHSPAHSNLRYTLIPSSSLLICLLPNIDSLGVYPVLESPTSRSPWTSAQSDKRYTRPPESRFCASPGLHYASIRNGRKITHSVSTFDLPPLPIRFITSACPLRSAPHPPQISSTSAAPSVSISSRPPIFRASPRRRTRYGLVLIPLLASRGTSRS
ncbi:hypothetical protein R3P38DRAFT_1252694 [Favolaschia claudopus]|uniref:Uncharacterized protein n=1 Tax=Favolaschia claudopus TaxID=2862362 RepID=A0AAW0B384_9AGAR